MAKQYKKHYTNESEYMYDLAKSSEYFRYDTYNDLISSNLQEDYAYAVAGAINKDASDFVMAEYDLLEGQDRLTYLLNHTTNLLSP